MHDAQKYQRCMSTSRPHLALIVTASTNQPPACRLWEIHTPQVISVPTLLRGFDKVRSDGLEVTDDVSIGEKKGEVGVALILIFVGRGANVL